jgi:hypothetical protein
VVLTDPTGQFPWAVAAAAAVAFVAGAGTDALIQYAQHGSIDPRQSIAAGAASAASVVVSAIAVARLGIAAAPLVAMITEALESVTTQMIQNFLRGEPLDSNLLESMVFGALFGRVAFELGAHTANAIIGAYDDFVQSMWPWVRRIWGSVMDQFLGLREDVRRGAAGLGFLVDQAITKIGNVYQAIIEGLSCNAPSSSPGY